jgi:hypothetical protein
MLTAYEIETLFEILGTQEGTLDDAYAKFSKDFTSEAFKTCCEISNLLSDNVKYSCHLSSPVTNYIFDPQSF